jgi:hypothetical protein
MLVEVESKQRGMRPAAAAALAAAAPAVRTRKLHRGTPRQVLQRFKMLDIVLTAFSAVSACLLALQRGKSAAQ